MGKSTRPRFGDPGFPLWKHKGTSRWCKKVRGRFCYFGDVVNDPDGSAAYERWLDERDDLLAGRTPATRRGLVTLADVVNQYLDACETRVKSGELSAVSLADYHFVGKLMVKHLGRHVDPGQLRPTDFAKFRAALAKRYALTRLSKSVTVCRQIIKWAWESEIIERMPRFGPEFSTVSKKTMKRHRQTGGGKTLTADEIRRLLSAADPKWKAILLVCVNCAYGNSDIARLRIADVPGEWLEVPRGKTGGDRKAWLWPETRQAIREALQSRPKPKPGAENLLFLSGHGGPMVIVRETGKRTDLTIEGFRRLAKKAKIYRHGMGLYWLRHTSATRADDAKDRIATQWLLGHIDGSMTGEYVDDIDVARVKAVCDHIRKWLFPSAEGGEA
jgi:integrase